MTVVPARPKALRLSHGQLEQIEERDQESIFYGRKRGPLRLRSGDAARSTVAIAAAFFRIPGKGRKSGKGNTQRGKAGAGSCTHNAVWATLEPGTTSIGKLTWTTGGGTSSHRPPESVPEKMSPMSRCRCLPPAVAQGQGQGGSHYGGCEGDKRAGCSARNSGRQRTGTRRSPGC